jgi:hypothetical protein
MLRRIVRSGSICQAGCRLRGLLAHRRLLVPSHLRQPAPSRRRLDSSFTWWLIYRCRVRKRAGSHQDERPTPDPDVLPVRGITKPPAKPRLTIAKPNSRVRYQKMCPAGCRTLQASGLRSPEPQDYTSANSISRFARSPYFWDSRWNSRRPSFSFSPKLNRKFSR